MEPSLLNSPIYLNTFTPSNTAPSLCHQGWLATPKPVVTSLHTASATPLFPFECIIPFLNFLSLDTQLTPSICSVKYPIPYQLHSHIIPPSTQWNAQVFASIFWIPTWTHRSPQTRDRIHVINPILHACTSPSIPHSPRTNPSTQCHHVSHHHQFELAPFVYIRSSQRVGFERVIFEASEVFLRFQNKKICWSGDFFLVI